MTKASKLREILDSLASYGVLFLIAKEGSTVDSMRAEALLKAESAIKDLMREVVPEEADEGSHKGHYVYDEFCGTCNKGIGEEEYNKTYGYKWNACRQAMLEAIEKI